MQWEGLNLSTPNLPFGYAVEDNGRQFIIITEVYV